MGWGMSREDAEDYFGYNVLGSSLSGGRMPVYVLVERDPSGLSAAPPSTPP